MSTRAWLGLVVLTMVFGCVFGWGVRTCTSNDRYITALAKRMVAEATYFNIKTDALIDTNQKEIARAK